MNEFMPSCDYQCDRCGKAQYSAGYCASCTREIGDKVRWLAAIDAREAFHPDGDPYDGLDESSSVEGELPELDELESVFSIKDEINRATFDELNPFEDDEPDVTPNLWETRQAERFDRIERYDE